MSRGEVVTIIRSTPGGEDPYGDPLPGETVETDVTTLYPFAPRYANDSADPLRDGGRVIGGRIALPHDTDIRATDAVRVRGAVYRVEGDVADWRPAFGYFKTDGALDVNLVRGEVGTWQPETQSSS